MNSVQLWNDIKARAGRNGKIRRQSSGRLDYCSTLISQKQWDYLFSLCHREGSIHPADDRVLGVETGIGLAGQPLKCGAVKVSWNELTANE
jgi:hypothetical protein